jgi:hypothetical protein
VTPAELVALHLKPCAWSVTDGEGYVSLYKDERRAEAYSGHVRDALIDGLVKVSSVQALLDGLGKL